MRGGRSECHSAGLAPKRSWKRSRKACVSAISGSRISTCLPCVERRGHRLEIDLGLARAGDAVEQRHAEAAGSGAGPQRICRGALFAGQVGLRVARIGCCDHRPRRDHHRLEHALRAQPVDDGRARRRPHARGRSASRPARRRQAPARARAPASCGRAAPPSAAGPRRTARDRRPPARAAACGRPCRAATACRRRSSRRNGACPGRSAGSRRPRRSACSFLGSTPPPSPSQTMPATSRGPSGTRTIEPGTTFMPGRHCIGVGLARPASAPAPAPAWTAGESVFHRA